MYDKINLREVYVIFLYDLDMMVYFLIKLFYNFRFLLVGWRYRNFMLMNFCILWLILFFKNYLVVFIIYRYLSVSVFRRLDI